jgi:hypothetical protein
MRPATYLVAAVAISLAVCTSGCASFDPAAMAEAINKSDTTSPCYKDVQVSVTPMMLFGWYVPIISGTFKKTCNGQAQAPAVPALKPPSS